MIKRLLAALSFAVVVATPTGAATINYAEGGAQADIPGLTGFATTGRFMDGMTVTACFTVLGCETRFWADRAAPNSGGVAGTNWDLSMAGDTFSANWTFDIGQEVGQLVSLLLDGRTGLTIFDRTFGGAFGTDGSALGTDWTTALNGGTIIDVTYLDRIGIGGAAPVGDIFQQVFVEFGTTGPRTDFTFVVDTDNDARLVVKVPEPSTLMLLALAMFALGRFARKPH
jgi:hypothetical protein